MLSNDSSEKIGSFFSLDTLYLHFICIIGGLVLTNGEAWQSHRRIALQSLRNMGMGKHSLQRKIIEEAEIIGEELAAISGRPFAPRSLFYKAVSNIICSIIFGHRFEYSDAKFKSVISKIDAFANEDELGSLIDVPLVFLQKTLNDYLGIKAFIDEEISSHVREFDEADPRDGIDMFLAEIERARTTGEKTSLDKSSFWASIADLFVAGTETTTTYLSWILLFLAGEQEIKEKVGRKSGY